MEGDVCFELGDLGFELRGFGGELMIFAFFFIKLVKNGDKFIADVVELVFGFVEFVFVGFGYFLE